ncbi:glycine/sarcosine/betaine reductase component B subunit [Candidatus Formimonas warabiya]|uniref:Glycine reductase n=1 Tax=Formimonas warabiya TaxID=1761012 RepID=A0A3G1KYC6_FORW1|nr:glycine/sarcosine/betaine reductase component B subunit [Candidatus Formimonas warabiya]ATW27215.1 hypothetical protein DCMF_22860 [Candidatus Formimonas warabiya]
MSLRLNFFPVKEVAIGEKAGWTDGRLDINLDDVRTQIMKDAHVKQVCFDLVHPGESTRVIHVLDVIQPRVKADGSPCFPGFLAPSNSGGQGVTNVLEGLLVASCAQVEGANPLFTPKEGIIDMGCPGADLSPFAGSHLFVLKLEFLDGLGDEDLAQSINLAGFRAATVLAGITLREIPARQQVLDSRVISPNLPGVGVVMQLGGEGPLHDTYIAGHSVTGMLPLLTRYEKLADGMVVANNFTYASQRNYTCLYQQNMLLESLLARADEVALRGVILTRGYSQSRDSKLRMAGLAAEIADASEVEGVIVTTEGAGNAHIDTMLTCQECEKRGLHTVILLNEMSDTNGNDPGFIDFVPEADAIVSVGNREEIIELPPVDQVVGGTLLEGKILAAGEIKVPLRDICGATNEMGAWRNGAQAF